MDKKVISGGEPQPFTMPQLLDELSKLDDFISHSQYYSKSGEATEIDDIFKYERNELNYKEHWDRELIATYGEQTEYSRAHILFSHYELLINERLKELKELAEQFY